MEKKALDNDRSIDNKTRRVALWFKKNSLLRDIAIMILCCFAGVALKRLINPFANMVTDALHVPGGISTAFSLMFLVIASLVTKRKWCATVMGSMQALTALAIGMVGSMGILMPLAYIIPGIAVDLVMLIPEKGLFSDYFKAFIAGILSSVSAALFADLVVFHLPIKPLTVYLLLATVSGAICGGLAGASTDLINKLGEDKGSEEG
ncbi:hypothetical protein SAMN02910369_00966 [Lachnospiraceae bacterium NE2001]|nr:hypothetical protein SAMN02910369_00966 [Lachnospiraceae bacterium NE2001]